MAVATLLRRLRSCDASGQIGPASGHASTDGQAEEVTSTGGVQLQGFTAVYGLFAVPVPAPRATPLYFADLLGAWAESRATPRALALAADAAAAAEVAATEGDGDGEGEGEEEDDEEGEEFDEDQEFDDNDMYFDEDDDGDDDDDDEDGDEEGNAEGEEDDFDDEAEAFFGGR